MLWVFQFPAWSMGFCLVIFPALGLTGYYIRQYRLEQWQRQKLRPQWLSNSHWWLGMAFLALMVFLWLFGVVGTIWRHGSLQYSGHFWAGNVMLALTLLSVWSAQQMNNRETPTAIRLWLRPLHLGTNAVILIGLAWVSWTGWEVVQQYIR
ncbi:DUF4079 domain-containing protein [Leptolyngbya sp. FACHB-261]|uniref:DUF4079 domain-containing protein n=1 Tax=Leptolyngbya sp. FACHB-261 TaxID=2692806 RepID=UPI0016842BFD|nr:DUF4079 domain-containing protein [Leptolyngbya sp. FACHB-261]MBD2099321.1 DUF4079 domain-containing protein [Leptolyngbya sp. FACHB-261]